MQQITAKNLYGTWVASRVTTKLAMTYRLLFFTGFFVCSAPLLGGVSMQINRYTNYLNKRVLKRTYSHDVPASVSSYTWAIPDAKIACSFEQEFVTFVISVLENNRWIIVHEGTYDFPTEKCNFQCSYDDDDGCLEFILTKTPKPDKPKKYGSLNYSYPILLQGK